MQVHVSDGAGNVYTVTIHVGVIRLISMLNRWTNLSKSVLVCVK